MHCTYRSQERVEQLRRVRNEVLVVLIDRQRGEDGVLPDERVSVLLSVSFSLSAQA